MTTEITTQSRRLPLLVGARAFRLLTVLPSSLLLAAGFSLLLTVTASDLPFPLLRIAAQVLSLFALIACLSPVAILAQLKWVGQHLAGAFGVRACDIELSAGTLSVLGGSSHGFQAKLSELRASGAIKLEDGRFSLTPATGKSFSLELPHDADERASLEALAASLQAAALGSVLRPEPLSAASGSEHRILRCVQCGAPLTPTREPSVRCAFCSAECPVPSELARRIESNELVDTRRRRDERLCLALAKQPQARLANAVAFGSGVLSILLAAVANFAAAMMAFIAGDLGGPPRWGAFALAICGASLLAISFAHSVLGNRTALRVLTLGFSALPSAREGAGPRCRNCGAPLPAAAGSRVLTRCVYCDADNLGALDLGLQAALIQRFSRGELSPARALTRLRRRRLLTRFPGFVGVLLLVAAGIWQHAGPLVVAPEAMTVNLPSDAPDPGSELAADTGAVTFLSAATLPGTVLAVLRSGQDVDLIVADAAGIAHRVHKPEGAVSASELTQAERVPAGSEYAARNAGDPLVVVSATGMLCATPNGPQELLYGGGTFSDVLLEAPESLGGCSALITTRAGKDGHFHVRQCDASGTRTRLLDARQPALAPDGLTLAASVLDQKSGVFELALFPAQGAPRLLTHGPVHADYASFAPNGERIAFLTEAVQDSVHFSEYTGSTALCVINLKGRLQKLTKGDEPMLVRPVWTERGIFLAQFTGTKKHPETTLLQFFPSD
jgi:hypothetical protein